MKTKRKRENLPTKNKKIETTKECKRNFTNPSNKTILGKII
jgi:hypothetical protein